MAKKFRTTNRWLRSGNRKSKSGPADKNPNRVGLVALVLAFTLCGTVVEAQLTKLTIGTNTLSGSGLPAWIAKDAGIFRKNGLDVQIV